MMLCERSSLARVFINNLDLEDLLLAEGAGRREGAARAGIGTRGSSSGSAAARESNDQALSISGRASASDCRSNGDAFSGFGGTEVVVSVERLVGRRKHL